MQMKSHLGLTTGQLPETFLIAGDPKRVAKMASFWDSCDTVGENRGYLCVTGSYRGLVVGACCTGIGGPSVEVAIVELMQHGVRNIIRVGTCGGIDPNVEPGDLVIMNAAIRYNGAADAYAPLNYPAVSDWEYTWALANVCKSRGYRYHTGIGISVDSFFGTKPWLTGLDHLKTESCNIISRWAGSGVLAMEMEAATLMVVGSLIGLRTATICTVGSNIPLGTRPTPAPGDDQAILAACDGIITMHSLSSKE